MQKEEEILRSSFHTGKNHTGENCTGGFQTRPDSKCPDKCPDSNRPGSNSAPPRRKSIRLKNYDYSRAGLYFITICAQGHKCIFGQIKGGQMELSEAGRIVESVWEQLPSHYPTMQLGEFIIMPNHIHGIICITDNEINSHNLQNTKADTAIAQEDLEADTPIAQADFAAATAITRTGFEANAAIVRAGFDANAAIVRAGFEADAAIVRAGFKPAPTNAPTAANAAPAQTSPRAYKLSEMIRALKTFSARKINELRGTPGEKIWQRNYYEHIIRNSTAHQRIAEYILTNPLRWETDKFKTERLH